MQTGTVDYLARGVRRVVAPNPSAMTGPGTNSYILGSGRDLVLVDPGPLIASHINALMAAIGGHGAVAKIIVTHAHLDHSAAAPRISALTGAPVFAFGCAGAGRSATMQRLADAGMQGGGEGVDTTFRPDHLLHHAELVPTGDTPLRVIHTPGHMGGHICLGYEDIIFSGDHAMGWASSLISPPDGDMGAYVASLGRLLAEDWSLMLPGHGAPVVQVRDRLTALRAHRHAREAALLNALSSGPATAPMLTAQVYTDTPPQLIAAAQRNVLAHLIDLTERNLVTTPDLPGPDAQFTPVSPPP